MTMHDDSHDLAKLQVVPVANGPRLLKWRLACAVWLRSTSHAFHLLCARQLKCALRLAFADDLTRVPKQYNGTLPPSGSKFVLPRVRLWFEVDTSILKGLGLTSALKAGRLEHKSPDAKATPGFQPHASASDSDTTLTKILVFGRQCSSKR